MFYSKEELQTLPRKNLQKLCKQFSIKANKKNNELVSDLVEYFAKLQQQEQELKNDLATEWLSEEEGETSQSSQDLKNELMKEVEKRANEKLSKIPRFYADNVTIPDLLSPATQQLKSAQKKHLNKMESIDVYLEKKRSRTQYQLSYHNKLKEKAQENLKKMKLSHNTPKTVVSDQNKQNKEGTPLVNRSKAVRKSTTFKVDKEVSFNFVSKLKSPTKVFKPTLKEKNINVEQPKANPRKSVQFSKTENRKSSISAKSPAMKFGNSSAQKKTPAKFDLQASLKKRLSYKPHTGKLKNTYLPQSGPSTSFNANSTFTLSSNQSVKEMTKPKVTRADRRKEVNNRRGKKRTAEISKRRGVLV